MNFGGKIFYKDFNRILKYLFFNYILSIGDILWLFVIIIEEYGEKWVEVLFEKK